jgi:hypothetical protein
MDAAGHTSGVRLPRGGREQVASAVMPHEARLIVRLPRGGSVEQRLRDTAAVAAGDIALDPRDADADGRIAPPDVGQIVLSVPSPETFVREPEGVRRVIDGAGDGDAPLVVVVEAAEELRDDELAVVLDAADRTERPVVLHVAGPA